MNRSSTEAKIERVGLAAILGLFAALSVWYGAVTPLFEGPDEAAHFQYVKYVADGLGLPRLGPSSPEVLWEGLQQPPLYYAVGAALIAAARIDTSDLPELLWHNPHRGGETGGVNLYYHTEREAFPYHGTTLAVHLLRWLNTVFGLLTVAATFLAARQLIPAQPALALGAAAVVAFNPQFIATSGLVTNDVALAGLCSIGTWLLLRALRSGSLPASRALALGLMAALAAATKSSGLVFGAWCGLGIAVLAWRRHEWRTAWLGWAAIGGLTAALAGWWYVRNSILYGGIFPYGAMIAIKAETIRPEPLQLGEAVAYSAWLQKSFWGVFGNGVLMDFSVYAALEWLMRLGLLGLVVLAARTVVAGKRIGLGAGGTSDCAQDAHKGLGYGRARPGAIRSLAPCGRLVPNQNGILDGPAVWGLGLLAIWSVLVYAALLRFMQTVDATNQGRLLFPAIAALSILLVVGWASFAPRRWTAAPAAALGLALLSLAVIAPIRYVVPAYAQPAPDARLRQSASGPAPGALVRFGDGIELLSYEITPPEIKAGSPIHVAFEWRCVAPMTESYKLFVHILGFDGERLTQIDTVPYQGRFATVLWKPGQEFRDEYDLFISGKARPSLGKIQLGFFRWDDPATRLPAFAADNRPIGDHFELSPFKIGPKKVTTPEIPSPLDVRFGESITLRGTDGLTTTVHSGETLPLTLYWEASGPVAQDYTAFIHVLNSNGDIVAQQDMPPQHGNYPTSIWGAGETIADERALPLPASLPAGEYRLALGLYEPQSGQRLPAKMGGHDVPDGRVVIGAVQVR